MTEPNRPGDAARPSPTLHVPDLSHVHQEVGSALAHAEQAIRPYDAFISRLGSSTDLIHHVLTPQIVGRGFEVGAMKGHGHAVGHEPAHILRDGRLILAEGHRPGAAEQGNEASQGAHGRPLLRGEARQVDGRVIANMRGAEGSHAPAQEFSLFEKVFLAHFEGGHAITPEALKNGQFRFLPKTEKAWAEFFQRFGAFTMLKSAKPGEVQALVFRGWVKPDGTLTKEGKALLAQSQSKGVLVSDIQFKNGKTDKFARLGLMSEHSMETLAKMNPGDALRPELVAELLKALGTEDFSYLSLSHKVVNPDMAKTHPTAATEAYMTPEKMKAQAIRDGVRDVTQGIALSAKTEQLMAEKLDIRSGMDRRAGEAIKGAVASTSMQGLFADKKKKKDDSGHRRRERENDDSPVFVPWYQHIIKPQKFKGKPRWWVPFTYFLAGSIALLAAYYIFRYWMR